MKIQELKDRASEFNKKVRWYREEKEKYYDKIQELETEYVKYTKSIKAPDVIYSYVLLEGPLQLLIGFAISEDAIYTKFKFSDEQYDSSCLGLVNAVKLGLFTTKLIEIQNNITKFENNEIDWPYEILESYEHYSNLFDNFGAQSGVP